MPKTQFEIASELRDYLLTKERTQRDLADKIGVSTAHLSNYLRGAERISRKVADRIVELWPEIRLAFILSGDGSLLEHAPAPAPKGDADALKAENLQLRAELARKSQENDRLLGIIEKLTEKSA